MAAFVRGDVVVLPFPFSDLTQSKRRPALVLAPLQGDDLILCQITGSASGDPYVVAFDHADFHEGGLSRASYIRPSRLFTADSGIILYRVGRLAPAKVQDAIQTIVWLLTA